MPLKFKKVFASETPLVVTVLPVDVAKKFMVPAAVLKATPVAAFSQLPNTLMTAVAPDVIVTVFAAGPAMLISRQVEAVPIVAA